MSTHAQPGLCGHCGLPVGPRGTRASIDGDQHAFCCYGCSLAWQVGHGNGAESEATWLLIRLGIGAFLAMNIKMLSMLMYFGAFDDGDTHLVPLIHLIMWILATPMLAILGWPFARDALREAGRRQLTANALMTMGVLAAYAYSTIAAVRGADDVYFDTVALLLVLFTLGRLLEASARARAVRSLAPMLEAERQWVNRVGGDGVTQRIRIGDVLPGMHIRVLPGERIAVDGIVCGGTSHVDESIVTGEIRPIAKRAGSPVQSGSINHEGCLDIEAGVAGTHGRWAMICRAVQDALRRRSPSERLTDRVAGAFVPLVMLLALLAAYWWMAYVPLPQALFTGLAVLVVACPCALGLAAPLATTMGISTLVQHGVLVRSPEVFENLTRARVVAFDKTGTLTTGRFELIAIETDDADSADEVLRYAAGAEQGSEHPLARAVTQAAAVGALAPIPVRDVRALPCRGVTATCAAGQIVVGASSVLNELGWPVPAALKSRIATLEASGRTIAHVAWTGRWRGALVFGDTLLPDAATTVRSLRARGLRCVLLTGDLPAAAQRVALATGIDEWHAQLSPEGKLAELERLSHTFGPTLMVGDGLNDGPVLAAAAVGIAVGSATDLARESADVTLPLNGLHLLPSTLVHALRIRRTILTNLLWAFGYNAIAIALAAAGYLSPVWAALIMAGSSLLVIANSMRLDRKLRPAGPPSDALPGTVSVPGKWSQMRPVISSGFRVLQFHARRRGS